jgi:hypothetical protein
MMQSSFGKKRWVVVLLFLDREGGIFLGTRKKRRKKNDVEANRE